MRPVIGVVPLFDEEKDSVWMVPGYLSGIEEAGGLPLILPFTAKEEEVEEAAALCNGFLFTGGHDVDPSVYGQERKQTCGPSCSVRDALEKKLFQTAIENNKPVFGICRGIQMINALCGGTLYQDLPTEYACRVEHHMEPPYDRTAHQVEIVPDTPLSGWLRQASIGVNSYHHQAVKQLGSGLKPMAFSEDGLVEAVYMPEQKFVAAVQWHPEFNYQKEESSRILFGKFVEACGT